MKLRSGKLVTYRAIKSRSFNVRSRAPAPSSENVLVTSNFEKSRLAKQHQVIVFSPEPLYPANLANSYKYETDLNKLSGVMKRGKTYLLLDYADDHLYYGIAPLDLRGARSRVAKGGGEGWLPPPLGDELNVEVHYTEACTKGSEKPTRDGVMGGSARNYARAILGKEAGEQNWEWLHIVGHALGGNNEAGNLVAGTYDANTHMIPWERKVHDLAAETNPGLPIHVRWDVALYPDSWLAIDLRMTISGITSGGFFFSSPFFHAQSDLLFDKLQYDLAGL